MIAEKEITMKDDDECHTWCVQIDPTGQMPIPRLARQALGWDAGTQLVLESDGHSLRLLTLSEFTQELS